MNATALEPGPCPPPGGAKIAEGAAAGPAGAERPAGSGPADAPPEERPAASPRGVTPPRPEMTRRTRAALFVAGWLVLAIGVAGLVLPGIQGVVTILAGLALLSLVSQRVHGWMRRGLRRWPELRRRVERFRRRMLRRFGKPQPPARAGRQDGRYRAARPPQGD